jgi:hypothetical protein
MTVSLPKLAQGQQPTFSSDPAVFHVDATARTQLRTRGHVALDGLWSEDVAAALASEAGAVWRTARPPTIGPNRRVAPSRTGERPTLIGKGPMLERLHLDLVGPCRRLTGQVLDPSFAAYYFYSGDDEVRLHLDTPQCDLTMISEVLGPLGPLHLHPELMGMTIDELVSLEADPAWERESGVPIAHPRLGVTAFRGRRLPHHRPGRSLAGLGAVAAHHYCSRY